jgi:hypothetical protein
MSVTQEYTEADDAIGDAYRRQARECRAAMHAVLAGGWDSAALVLAVQAVRASANALLATRAGIAATGYGADPVAMLYRHAVIPRAEAPLAAGADVLAHEEDLYYFGYEPERGEARHLLDLADRFCDWAVG